jgi:hypothetical protein
MPSPLDRFKRPKQQKPFLRAEDANALDADAVAAVLGLTVTRQGRHYELSNGMRGTMHERMVWCHKDGSGIGDNCELAQLVAGVPFRSALELLLSEGVPTPRPTPARAPAAVLTLPSSTPEHRQAGRAYLIGRGVSEAAIEAAERCGMLCYCAGGVLFVGRDADGTPRSATRRGYLPTDPRPKRDLAGTDKSWPAYIPGQPNELWIVEGGVDALALMTMNPGSYPSILVSGGVHVTSWLENPRVQARLARLWRCVVAAEWEKDQETQQRTDEQRKRLVERLGKLVPEVSIWTPPAGVKDLGEMLTGVAAPVSEDDKETY